MEDTIDWWHCSRCGWRCGCGGPCFDGFVEGVGQGDVWYDGVGELTGVSRRVVIENVLAFGFGADGEDNTVAAIQESVDAV